ncbi:MAG: DUF1552 domain-containing protein [Bdellovibrionia bacterium]
MKNDRRRFLKSLGAGMAGGLVLTPWDMIAPLRAEAQTPSRKRLLVFHTSNGSVLSNWMSTGTETNFTLSRILKPLEPHKADLLVLKGLKPGPGDHVGHRGTGCILTGVECNGEKGSSSHRNISVDQFIADHFAAQNRFHSLQFCAADSRLDIKGWADYGLMSAKGPNQPVKPELDPVKAFDRVFSGVTGTGTAPDPKAEAIRLRRRSVLDTVISELSGLKNRLSGAELAKIDAHLSSIREIERTLQAPVSAGGICTVPGRPSTMDLTSDATFPTRLRLHTDIMIQAMACGLTQVGTVDAEGGQGRIKFTWLGIGEHHDVSHSQGEEKTKINEWYAMQFEYMIRRMKSIPDGAGTMLDNTVLAWVNELGAGGDPHISSNLPWVLAGRCGGYFKTGRFVDVSAENRHNVLVSLMHAMGVAKNTFGIVSANPSGKLS